MNNAFNNWQPVFFDFLVGAALILAIFRLIQFILPVFLSRAGSLRWWMRVTPVIEAVAWVLFLSWYTFRFAEIRSVYTFVVIALLVLLLFWISRYYLREVVAGILFRAAGKFIAGDMILHEQVRGTIKKFGAQTLEIESHDGQIIYIPYSRLTGSITTRHESREQSAAYTFVLKARKEKPGAALTRDMEQFLFTLPWSSTQKTPVVTITEETPVHYQVEITCYPLEKPFGKKIEQRTLEAFEVPGE